MTIINNNKDHNMAMTVDEATLLASALCNTSISNEEKEQQDKHHDAVIDNMLDNLINQDNEKHCLKVGFGGGVSVSVAAYLLTHLLDYRICC